ncbi:serine/threonine-protein kinase [Terrabacter carboxydivorans]|uniref:serine/threonine-protein kinase n=1 Tax=Terrabacter carboxydivorans TaxID=619730 RepID=UPI0031D19DBF
MTDTAELSSPPSRPEVPGHRLEAVLGTGASAVVWAGTDATGRRVAVKVPHRGRDELDRHQSVAEQEVLLAVQHEHLVPLRSVVPLADGREALVFDLVRGAQLAGMVRSRGHLRPGEVVTVLTPVCEAVAHLHSAGGLHADISAGNITLTHDGRPVLLDLGAARVAGREPGAVHGTPGFVAPEVRLGTEPDESADVYALGAVAWFCLTGNGAPDTMMRLDRETVVSHVGPELADVVAAAIDPDPHRRPGAAELARLFYDAVEPEAVEVVVGADEASALTHRLRADAGREPVVAEPSPRRWPRRALASGVIALPLLAAAGWALAARGPDTARQHPTDAVATRELAPTAAARVTGRPAVPPVPPATTTATTTAMTAKTATTPPTAARTASAVPATRPASGAPATGGAPATADVLVDPTSPSARAQDLLQALSDRRAEALVARDTTRLTLVHAPGSPSLANDQALVTELVDASTRWEGLRLEVAQAVFVSGTASEAVVRARVDWTAYAVVTASGQRTERPADAGALLDFRLVRGAQGWRISAISAAPAT